MVDKNRSTDPRAHLAGRQYIPVSAEPPGVPDEAGSDVPRVAISLGVADGFRFGCGLLLAGVAFYAGLVVIVAAAAVIAMIFNIPLPLGLGAH